jgi:hypothetical protein
MSLNQLRAWLQQVGCSPRASTSWIAQRRFRPRFLTLEDRVLPSASVVNESEPNDTLAQASSLSVDNGLVIVDGAISSFNDGDYFKFKASAKQRVWAYVDTGGPQTLGAGTRDSALTLIDSSGGIEVDNNDGTGNGGDGTIESQDASVIAGHLLPAGGTYYLQVLSLGGNGVLSPYRLYLRLTDPSFNAEVEGNNTLATATNIGVDEATSYVRGTISHSGDRDYYSFQALRGDRVFIAADSDPERDGIGPDLTVDLYQSDFTHVLTADSSGATTAKSNPTAEAFSYVIPASGTYFVGIAGVGSSTGSYDLIVAGNSHPGSLSFGASDYSASEADGVAAVTVLRSSNATDGRVTVDYAITGGSATPGVDYTPVAGTFTFGPGETSKTLLIPIAPDAVVEGAENFTVTLSDPNNGATLGAQTTTVVTILDATVPPPAPTEVMPLVTATPDRARFNARRRRYRQEVFVYNAGGAGLSGPVRLVLDGLSRKVKLRNPAGFSPAGSPFVVITPGGLGPGQALTVVLEFTGNRRPVYVPRVVAGSSMI